MAKKLWGGRFGVETDRDFFKFQKSIHYDYKLARFDVCHSIIHVAVLKEAKIITEKEARTLDKILHEILKDIEKGDFKPDLSSEDIHTDIQNKVEKKAGKLGLKLHTLRSRNDQVVFDTKWYCNVEAKGVFFLLNGLKDSLGVFSRKYSDFFIPGYTHTQRAQVVKFKDYLEVFSLMFERDQERLNKFLEGYCLYIGSGALAGSPVYQYADKKLFEKYKKSFNIPDLKVPDNTLDNVSNRDFIIELLSILSILQLHLSRMAEDFLLYSTKEFDYFDLPEEFCTGSSLMPHKKNPDFLELARGYTGRIHANLISLLTLMKGLPLTYNRDMQLDKEPLFSSVELIKSELKVFTKLIPGIKLNKASIEKALEDESLYATKLSEFLVYKGVPFKEAHTIVGRLIKYSIENSTLITDMSQDLLNKFSDKFEEKKVMRLFDPLVSVKAMKLKK